MTEIPPIAICRLPHGAGLALPAYASAAAAGMDIMAAIDAPVVLAPMHRTLIPTGFSLALPTGMKAQIRPRSGLAYKHGVTVLNSPGTIDSDYRGEIKVLLINLGQEDFAVTPAMRVAQMIIGPVAQITWQERDTLPHTVRGIGGFGSTGLTEEV